ncbi:hypothetical protein [Streptomyces sp. SID3343]|uniref:hypothetical protein n=1 Tax=Streptomyces sp. SID3343 TaxID=2690260 RepID=UPI00136F43C5|nr:hypothetical protein [Streptomyces sp. SID3343]MYW02810.1 hypothetical protein [Streptomyces sp. SID3343]
MIDPLEIELVRFLHTWHGPPIAPREPLPSEQLWLPEPLREWYELSSQWSNSLTDIKMFCAPGEIREEDGKAIFLEEPGGHSWAIDVNNQMDVYERQLNDRWEKSSEELPEFLLHNALNEVAYKAPAWRSSDRVAGEYLPVILAPMIEVGFGEWQWPRPGHRVFLGAGLVANIGPASEIHWPWGNAPGYSEVHIAATAPELLIYLSKVSGIRWSTHPYSDIG